MGYTTDVASWTPASGAWARRPPAPEEPGEVRWDTIRRVRRQIARGDYETQARWQVVIDRLIAEL